MHVPWLWQPERPLQGNLPGRAVEDVVRGADLLDSTPWQITLQRALGLAEPRYLHLPLILEPDFGQTMLVAARPNVSLKRQ